MKAEKRSLGTPVLVAKPARIWLWQLMWLVAVLLVLSALVEMVPRHYRATYSDWAVLEVQYIMLQWVGPFARGFGAYVQLLVVLEYLATAIYVGTAFIIFWRKPRDPLAIFVSSSLLLMAVPFGMTIEVKLPAWLGEAGETTGAGFPVIALMSMVGLYALLPTPRSVPSRLRWLFGFAVLLLSLALLLIAFRGWESDDVWFVFFAGFVATFATMCLALVFQIVHYRRTTDLVERQQHKWIIFGLGALIVYMLLLVIDPPVWIDRSAYYLVLNLIAPLVSMMLPLTIAFAIFRYHLWDIDLVLSHALRYGALAGLLVLLYVVTVGGLGLLLRQQENVLIYMAAVGLVAFMVQPLYRRLERTANRLIYGHRDDPMTVLARLGERLEGTMAPTDILPELADTVARQLKLPYVAIELADDGLARTIATAATPVEPVRRFPIVFQGQQLGMLVASPRAAGESLGQSDRRVLASVAHQAGPALHAVQLHAELQQSRQKLVNAREEERRRLRRELHDGLGPQLASQTLTIDAIARFIVRDPERAATLLHDLKGQSQEAIREIRRIVYDLRPPALDDLGLVAALREQADRYAQAGNCSVLIEAAPLPPLPAAVEAAAYRIVQEALTNVVRHAQAHSCVVTLAVVDDGTSLRLTIADDGRGLPTERRVGIGIQSMRERAEELGGDCIVRDRPGGGVLVNARLPCLSITARGIEATPVMG